MVDCLPQRSHDRSALIIGEVNAGRAPLSTESAGSARVHMLGVGILLNATFWTESCFHSTAVDLPCSTDRSKAEALVSPTGASLFSGLYLLIAPCNARNSALLNFEWVNFARRGGRFDPTARG